MTTNNLTSVPKKTTIGNRLAIRLLVYTVVICTAVLVLVRVETHVKWVATNWVLTQERINGKECKPLKQILGIEHSFKEDEFFDHLRKGDTGTVFLYLSAGMKPNVSSADGLSAMDIAVAQDNIEMAKLLIGQGANPNSAGPDGTTPLIAAVKKQNLPMVRTLVGLRANVNGKAADGKTPLMLAILQENTALGRMLIDMGSNVNLVDQSEQSILHYAIKTDNSAMVRLALNAGANINKANSERLTPLDLAIKGRNVQLLRLIKSAGGLTGRELLRQNTDDPKEEQKALSDEEWTQKALGLEQKKIKQPAPPESTPEEAKATEPKTPPTPTKPERAQTTQVRALGLPEGVWVRKGGLTLESVKVRAKNQSHITAKDVVVKVRLPDGTLTTLQGPSTLGRYETGAYSASVGADVFSGRKLKAVVTCSNCYR